MTEYKENHSKQIENKKRNKANKKPVTASRKVTNLSLPPPTPHPTPSVYNGPIPAIFSWFATPAGVDSHVIKPVSRWM
jgi:hypothetical protein